ncbi:MAG: polysaccharide deacetylase family protein [Planctomycetes bacterium]|nr:polysaccharide deacetylase family protein [Planctomycetota bacterium]
MLSLKIDIDTHDGMRTGVPCLLDCLKRHGVPGTFFLSMGPDRSGRAILQMRKPRFAQKMLTTGAPSLYGWRTILSGTLLPARPIATAFPEIVRRLEAEGHEAAIHAWDHRSWQDDLPRFKTARIRAHYDRSLAAYRALTGHDPAGIGAPSWMTTPESLRIQDGYPFQYASDLRGGVPCRLAVHGRELRIPQLPGTGPCLEELLAGGVHGEQALADALLAGLRQPTALTVLTLHAEVEGGPYLPVLERLLPRLAEFGGIVTMAEAARRLAGTLPLRAWCRTALPGRAFPVTTSRLPDAVQHA